MKYYLNCRFKVQGWFSEDYRDWYEQQNPPEYVPDNHMRIFGNSAIWLFPPKITLAANYGLSPTFYLSGEPHYTGDIYPYGGHTYYDITVNSIPKYTFDHFNYHGNNYGYGITLQFHYSDTFTAVYNWNPTYYDLMISAGSGGSTKYPYTPDTYQCLSYEYVQVEADPDPDWALEKWKLDGNDAGNNLTINVYMYKARTLEAVFTPAPSYKYVSSIDDYEGAVGSLGNMVGWQPDGQYAVLCSYWPYNVYGWISGELNAQASGHIYMYGYGEGDLDVYVSSNGYNWYYVAAPLVPASPGWIDCGTYGGTFNYVKASVSDDVMTV